MKQTRAHKPRLKHPQNGTRLSLKLTPRSKRNKSREKTREDNSCKDKTTWLVWETRLVKG
jgi:hypothetical protein